MAHWAELDENNKVIRVTVGDNNEPDEGYQWLVDNLGGRWIKTSYNTRKGEHILGGEPLRMNFAEVGSFYDEEKDAFIPLKPFTSWIFDEPSCNWKAPVEVPSIEIPYVWDEGSLSWIEFPSHEEYLG
jgi:hypothetical protein